MLRMSSGLSKPLFRWVSQVTASLGATLAATLIWAAVPHPGAAPGAAPELTSGGKFAARAIEPIAYDGLDTMPLPHIASLPAHLAAVAVEGAPAPVVHRASWEASVPLAPTLDRIQAHVPRVSVRAEARRVEPAQHLAIVPIVVASERSPEVQEDTGLLHRLLPTALPHVLPGIVATARDAWSVTASAGSTLVAHVVPTLQ